MAVASTVHLTTTLEAAGDLSDYRFHFMKNDSGQVTVAAVADSCVGVLQDKPEAEGRAAELVVVGETKIVAGDAIDALAPITTDTNGHAVAVTPGSDTTCYILGRALEAAGAANDIIRVAVNCINPARAA